MLCALPMRLVAVAVVLLTPAFALPTQSTTANYDSLVDRRREFTNFNIETTRGMVLDGLKLYALNTHASHVVVYDNFDPIADRFFPTIHQPIAIDLWEVGDGTRDVIVAGGATHALVRHRVTALSGGSLVPASGDIMGLAPLPSSPGDVVVHDALGLAYVSCQDTREVVEVDLATMTVMRSFPIPSRSPRFLELEVSALAPTQYEVFVTPMLSGNNTITDLGPDPSVVIALDDPSTAGVAEGLPDEDLFAITFGGASPVVRTVARGLGGVILDHGRNPKTKEYWVLSLEPRNADPTAQSEPGVKGAFMQHFLTILPDTTTNWHPVEDSLTRIDLDTGAPCSFPVALVFQDNPLAPNYGAAAIASSTNDRIRLLNENGGQLAPDIVLAAGAIPRSLEILNGRFLYVYNWGGNQVVLYDLFNPTVPFLVFFVLGPDPTPAVAKTGRAIWYDADLSANGTVTCNSCHPGGGSDFLGWQLSAPPFDRKDVMVTQSLLSIEDTFPYHWRGERDLGDFNRLAFPGLLGAAAPLDTTPGGDADAFEAFVFSLQAPRNPAQNSMRVIDSSLTTDQGGSTTADAVEGQDLFLNNSSLFGLTCSRCHGGPQGSVGDIVTDNFPTLIPSNGSMDIAHFRQLFAKLGVPASVVHPRTGATIEVPRLGYGFSHEGEFADIFEFLSIGIDQTPTGVFDLTDGERADVASFVEQADQGIAPAAQMAYFLNSATRSSVEDILLAQAVGSGSTPPSIDVALLGQALDVNGASPYQTWLYRPDLFGVGSHGFECGDPALQLAQTVTPGQATLQDFLDLVSIGAARVIVMGLPPGNGTGYALDYDRDGLRNGLEPTFGLAQFIDDFDGDLFLDGHEVDNGSDPTDASDVPNDTTPPTLLEGPVVEYTSATTAQIRLRFSEPVTYDVTYWRLSDPLDTRQRSRRDPVTEDTIVLQDLRPSSKAVNTPNLTLAAVASTYEMSITFTDRGGLVRTITTFGGAVTTDDHLEVALEGTPGFPPTLEISALSATVTPAVGGSRVDVSTTALAIHEGIVLQSAFTPHLGRIVVAQVLEFDGTTFVPAASADILPLGATTGSDRYYLPGIGQGVYLPIDGLGPLVFSPGTTDPGDGSGLAVTSFVYRGSATQIRLQMVALMLNEPGPLVNPPTDGPVFRGGLEPFAWQLPATDDDPVDLRGLTVDI